jgi:dTDP-4-dehydrorhamnose reductase
MATDQTRVLITGSAGMLASALRDLAPEGVILSGVDLADGDLSDPAQAQELIAARAPQTVIHCAAMTNVDGCTREPQKAFLHNAVATGNVAEACARVGARLVAISTDYVFDGMKGSPYNETDSPHPLNPYGESKLEGERRAAAAAADCLIVRSQWLYGPDGRNFVATIVAAGRERPELRVVDDEFGCPTYTRDLAPQLWDVAFRRDITGILHLTNRGVCTWAQLARRALDEAGLAGVSVVPISHAAWKSPTVRPAYSPLESVRAQQLSLTPLRPWQEAVSEYVCGYLQAD